MRDCVASVVETSGNFEPRVQTRGSQTREIAMVMRDGLRKDSGAEDGYGAKVLHPQRQEDTMSEQSQLLLEPEGTERARDSTIATFLHNTASKRKQDVHRLVKAFSWAAIAAHDSFGCEDERRSRTGGNKRNGRGDITEGGQGFGSERRHCPGKRQREFTSIRDAFSQVENGLPVSFYGGATSDVPAAGVTPSPQSPSGPASSMEGATGGRSSVSLSLRRGYV